LASNGWMEYLINNNNNMKCKSAHTSTKMAGTAKQ
jgi:hypothetical protein